VVIEPVLRAEVVKLLALKLLAVKTVVEREDSVALSSVKEPVLICPALRMVVNIRWLVRVLAVIELVASDDTVKKEPIRVLVEMVLNVAS
jgi:hypothetical protein